MNATNASERHDGKTTTTEFTLSDCLIIYHTISVDVDSRKKFIEEFKHDDPLEVAVLEQFIADRRAVMNKIVAYVMERSHERTDNID
jgi:hypothetical protein